jgi:cytochrome c55X
MMADMQIRYGQIAWLIMGFLPVVVLAELPVARQQALRHLLAQDCGSCHGLTLQGGLGPALTREALAGKSPEMLRAVILHGRPGTPMAPWQPFMNEAEAAWLVQQLLEGKAL